MNDQATDFQRNRNNSIQESNLWFVSGALFLAMTLASFSTLLGIPSWVFYTVAFALVVLLTKLSSSWETPLHRTHQHPRNLGRIFLYIAFFLVAAEAVWFGLVQKNWQLVAVWLPVTLLVGVFLNLAITVVIEKGLPFRFFAVPTAGLILGGLIGLILPDFGFANGLPLTFAILFLATGLWLRICSKNDNDRVW